MVLVATLNNGKKILLEPNHAQRKVVFRYLTEKESEADQLNLKGLYVWLEAPLYSTVEQGETIIFTTIEATAVVLNRF